MTFDSRRVQFLNCNDGDVVWSSDDDDDDDEAHANDLGDLVSDGVGSKSVLRSLSESKTTDWSTTIAAGSTDEVWLQQLDKCECVGFVASPDDDSLCYCGLEKRDHAVSLDEKDSKPQWNRNTNIRRSKTDAVGRIQFQDDALESWFFRLDFETKEEKLHYLLDNILHLSHYNLYIHFLDFQQGHDDLTDSQETQLQERLESGLKTLALRTKLFISSTGLKTGVSRHVHNVLKKLCSNPVFHAEVFRLACAPWGHLADSERSKFIGPASEQVQVIKPGPRDDDNVIGEELSPLFSHYLLFDDGVVSQTGTSSSIKHASSFRRRIKYTLDHLSEDAVSVYVLINGGSETLTHVYKAIRKGHPVIIIQRTGGYADKLARNYFLAQLSVQKFLDETGKIAVRSKLKPAKQLEDIEEEDEEKVRHILEHNNLTVFDPLHQTQGLDMVICQALLKGKQETQLNKLLESFQNKSSTKTAATTQISSVSSQQECFLGSESMQMDFLVEAMLNDSSDVVNVIFKGNLCLVKHFTLCRFCQLYNREQCLGSCLPLLRSANARNVETLGVKTAMFGPSDVRLVLRDLLGGSYPLTCKGKNCPCVLQEADVRSMKYYEPDMYRTCLPPIQELFLWALLTNHQKLAKVFWKHSQDKLASAVVAELLLTRLAGQESNTDRAFKLRENAKEFGDLAEEVLWVCYELDEGLTQKLLTQKSTWWGNKSVIELVYSFRSRSFVSKPACKSLLDKVWRGNLQSDRFLLVVPVILSMVPAIFLVPFLRVNSLEPRGISVPDNRQGKCCQGIRDFYSAPVVKYQLNVVAFLMLLLLFSYVLLVDLRPEFTVCQGVLCGWVFLYTVEEVRQVRVAGRPASRVHCVSGCAVWLGVPLHSGGSQTGTCCWSTCVQSSPCVRAFCVAECSSMLWRKSDRYVLLVDLRPEFSGCQGVLCGWVFLYTVEEVRQVRVAGRPASRVHRVSGRSVSLSVPLHSGGSQTGTCCWSTCVQSSPCVRAFCVAECSSMLWRKSDRYVLLVDLRPEFSGCQGVLCGWVFLYTVEEVRQVRVAGRPASRVHRVSGRSVSLSVPLHSGGSQTGTCCWSTSIRSSPCVRACCVAWCSSTQWRMSDRYVLLVDLHPEFTVWLGVPLHCGGNPTGTCCWSTSVRSSPGVRASCVAGCSSTQWRKSDSS
ncbi:transient receptor potential cation channel subfamily M member 2-like isoform X2 [Haliotis rufescens]|uniref:transient receptor potential cation channel subfamily M member 2-like isoform X2 n=1 Tax=Haliotis rufescens TaxID=6454 RepID=UPI00201F2F18|nr:transient receptor potential cation channel subfamily M member 2-like isoform X2 [Haliotis rufescens]